MNTKLTLSLDKSVIEEAKFYAKKKHVSLSKLIENYLHSLTSESDKGNRVSPLVESLTGIIPNDDSNGRDDYRDFLEEKYR